MASNGIQYVDGGGATVDGITVVSGGDITITPPVNLIVTRSLMINETINTDLTLGITINQDANDNDIMTFKSSDIDHPMTTLREADVWGAIRKVASTSGGLNLVGIKDADESSSLAIYITGNLGKAADTNQTTSGNGVCAMQAAITNGGTGRQAVAAGGNIYSIDNFGTTAFIIDGAGNLYANAGTSTTAVTVFDEDDDLALVRTLDIAKSKMNPQGFIESEFDRFLKYNENDLVEAGIIGAPLAEGGLICITRLQQLHNGALTQL
ncbi:hypothetical protein LCGC14_1846430, partial [marine sediment metagenome]